jgi:hypothetical protein
MQKLISELGDATDAKAILQQLTSVFSISDVIYSIAAIILRRRSASSLTCIWYILSFMYLQKDSLVGVVSGDLEGFSAGRSTPAVSHYIRGSSRK